MPTAAAERPKLVTPRQSVHTSTGLTLVTQTRYVSDERRRFNLSGGVSWPLAARGLRLTSDAGASARTLQCPVSSKEKFLDAIRMKQVVQRHVPKHDEH
jgi:hypothetical protein